MLLVASPWAFGAVEPGFELGVCLLVALLALLAAVDVLLGDRRPTTPCTIGWLLLALVLLGVFQAIALPPWLTAALAPEVQARRAELLPAGLAMHHESTLSIYPGATKRELVRLVAFILTFLAARQVLSTSASVRRLSLVVFANGCALALFAILQHLGSGPFDVYGAFRSPNYAFGPFLCRNHFPFYANACIGLGLGLLPEARRRDAQGRWSGSATISPWRRPAQALHEPRVLWLVAGLGLTAASVVLSGSRAGVLALSAAVVAAVAAYAWRAGRNRPRRIALLLGVLGCCVAAWVLLVRHVPRFATLLEGGGFQASRGLLWSESWNVARAHPLTGTGLGTYPIVLPGAYVDPNEAGRVTEHAHNEYLEAMVEGGVVRLALTILIVVALAWRCWSAYRDAASPVDAGLALGLWFALTSLAAHAFFDFGLHVPANGVLAATLMGAAANLGTWRRGRESAFQPGGKWSAFATATFLFVGAAFVAMEGWRDDAVRRLRLTAWNFELEGLPAQRRIGPLREAVRLAPDHAHAHLELARALLDTARGALDGDEGAVAASSGGDPWQEARDHLTRALVLCPTLPDGQILTVAASEDPARLHDRVARTAPVDATQWYLTGLHDLLAGKEGLAWDAWRRSLQLSDRQFRSIIQIGAARLGAAAAIDRLIPNEPALLYRAAWELFPDQADDGPRRAALRRVLDLLAQREAPLSGEDWRLRSKAALELNLHQDALASLEEAVRLMPAEHDWRVELARLLIDAQRRDDAARELRAVLKQRPDHGAAQRMLDEMRKDDQGTGRKGGR